MHPRRVATGADADVERDPEAGGQGGSGEDELDGPGGHDPAGAKQQRVGRAGGYLLHLVADHGGDRRGRVAGQSCEQPQQRLPRTEVETGGGFVQQEEFRVGHQRPGDLDTLAFTIRKGAITTAGQGVAAELGEELVRARRLFGAVWFPGPAEDCPHRGHHDVQDALAHGNRRRHRGADQTNP